MFEYFCIFCMFHICIYIYIYIYRERDGERERPLLPTCLTRRGGPKVSGLFGGFCIGPLRMSMKAAKLKIKENDTKCGKVLCGAAKGRGMGTRQNQTESKDNRYIYIYIYVYISIYIYTYYYIFAIFI